MGEPLLANANGPKLGVTGRVKYWLATNLSRIAYRLHVLALEREQVVEAIRRLRDDLEHSRLERSGYVDHYSGSREIEVREGYRRTFATLGVRQSEVVFRARHVLELVLDMIREDSGIRNVVNFGCSYGWLERQIASGAGNVKVWGVDRNERSMQLNRDEFGSANCRFAASDIFDFIETNPAALDASVFCHVNIGVYFLPAFLSKLYRAAYSRGARYLVAFEPSGLSRETGDYYRYSLEPKDPVVFRGPMLLNNYPHLMSEAGFDLVRADSLRPPHPQADFRSVCFVSRRRE